MTAQDDSQLVKIVWLSAGGVTFAFCTGLLLWYVFKDDWEATANYRIIAQLDEAEKTRHDTPRKAYQVYQEVLAEAADHRITLLPLKDALAKAEERSNELKAIIAEEDRKAQEAARRKQSFKRSEERVVKPPNMARLDLTSSMREWKRAPLEERKALSYERIELWYPDFTHQQTELMSEELREILDTFAEKSSERDLTFCSVAKTLDYFILLAREMEEQGISR